MEIFNRTRKTSKFSLSTFNHTQSSTYMSLGRGQNNAGANHKGQLITFY